MTESLSNHGEPLEAEGKKKEESLIESYYCVEVIMAGIGIIGGESDDSGSEV